MSADRRRPSTRRDPRFWAGTDATPTRQSVTSPATPVYGQGTRVPPGTTINYTVRDLYDRPWARIWEQYFEKDMKRPVAAEDLGGFK